MKLVKIKLINWYHFENVELDVDGSVLITGDNGCGKSTVLDAIQYVLTTEEIFNRAANEKSERKLEGYVRYKVATTNEIYKRNEDMVIGYIALEFLNEVDGKHLVVGVKIESMKSSSPISSWFIVNNSLSDLKFLDNKKPIPDLEDKNGAKIPFESKKWRAKEQIFYYLGLQKRSKEGIELIHRALAFRPVEKVSDFINKFILEERMIDVATLRSTVNNLKETGETLKEVHNKITLLNPLISKYRDYTSIKEKENIFEYLSRKIDSNLIKIELADYNNELNNANGGYDYCKNKISEIEILIDGFYTRQRDIVTEHGFSDISMMEKELENLKQQNSLVAGELERWNDEINSLTKLYFKINKTKTLVSEFKDAESKSQYYATVLSEINGQINTISEEKYGNLDKQKKLRTDFNDINNKIKRLKEKELDLPDSVNRLRNALSEEFLKRGITEKVSIFSELLNIEETEWTDAIEGYLDKQRFNFIINPQYYNLAVQVYNSLDKTKVYGTGIVNIAKLDNEKVSDNSLALSVTAKNEFANRYLNHLLGNVIRCQKVSELSEHSKAITIDCMKYSNHVLSRINYRIYETPLIGEQAVRKQLQICQERYHSLEIEIKDITAYIDYQNDVILSWSRINSLFIKDNSLLKEKYESNIQVIEEKDNYLKMRKSGADFLAITEELNDLEEKIEDGKKQKEELNNSKENYLKIIGKLEDKIKENDDKKNDLNSQIEQDKKDDFGCFLLAENKYETIQKDKNSLLAKKREVSAFLNDVDRNILILKRDITDIQRKFIDLHDCDYEVGIEYIQKYIDECNHLILTKVVDFEDKLNKIKLKCEDFFKQDFLAKLRENILEAERLFARLNNKLNHIQYGKERYKFSFSPKADRKALYEMIKSEDNFHGQSLFSEIFDSQYHDEIKDLFDKISSEQAGTEKVFEEYCDYRNYLDYDIEITTENGKQNFSAICREKSGGETQTPFYVIIAAAFDQFYKPNSMRLLLLDEAFDKMDDERIESMLKFFKSINFQLIVATPPAKITVIAQNVDNVFLIKQKGIFEFKHLIEDLENE